MDKGKILEAIKKLRESEKRKFEQTVDLIINLKSFDIKRDNVNVMITLPHAIRKPKILAFLNKKSAVVETITKDNFDLYADKKKMKKLIKNYDFFIASASLMPLVASKFGRFLGQAGKMPSPQLGILTNENDEEIKKMLVIFEKVVKVKSKEPSLKFVIGKENMKDEEIAENVLHAYNIILNALPRKEQQLRNALIKFTMSKAEKL